MTPLLMFARDDGLAVHRDAAAQQRAGAWSRCSASRSSPALFLTPILTVAAGFRNGGQLVGLAGGMTAAIFFAMATIATVTKKDFSFMGKFLFIGMILLIVASLANLFFQIPALSRHDLGHRGADLLGVHPVRHVSNIVRGGETNYIMATLGLFLNVYNIFISLLNILLAFTGNATEARAVCIAERGASAPRSFFEHVEHRDRLDVRGVREHVDDAGGGEPVAALVDEHRGIARERPGRCTKRRRCASVRRLSRGRGSALTSSTAPSRGGSISARSSRPSAARLSGVTVNRLAAANRASAGKSVVRARSPRRARTSAALPSTPMTYAPRRAMRQREIAEAAEEVGDALARLAARAAPPRGAPARG